MSNSKITSAGAVICLGAGLLALPFSSAAFGATTANLEIAIRPNSEAGGLNIRSPHCPGNLFDFRTCEGVIAGAKDFGLFQVKLPTTLGDGHQSWRRDGSVWRYSWPYAQGVTVQVEVEPDGDSLKLAYTLTNTGPTPLEDVQLHTCLPTTEAPAFFPLPTVRNGQTDWSELYQRLHVWSGGRGFTFAETSLAGTEVHLSLMRVGATPVRWAWWVNGPETFDLPLVALSSRDGRTTVALAFEEAVWTSANVGDDRACFHLFLWFGRIAPGQSVRVPGRLYVLAGSPEQARQRFARDFPSGTTKGFDVLPASDRLTISYAGKSVATYVFRDATIFRPYFANLETFDGRRVTRHHPPIAGQDADDHATMHPGLWLAFGDINGQDFWRNQARIEHVRFTQPPAAAKERLTFATESRLLAADGTTLGSLTNGFTLTAQPDAWLLKWDATFHASAGDLTFGDQEEMGFGVRVATALTEKNGGVITSSTGLKTAKHTWGQPAEWCDYSCTLNGQPAGITLMAAPQNFRPSWWHNRDYGLMVANPFGREAMKQGAQSAVTVRRGETLRLRFGAVIHSGVPESSDTRAAWYERFRSEGEVNATATRPNILWFVVDDMSAHLSCYGETTIRTPHLDLLAREGTQFQHAFVTAPVCSPCRSALITGCYQTSIGAHQHRSGRGVEKIQLPDGVRPIPELFQQAGYFTCNGSGLSNRTPTGAAAAASAAIGKTDYNFEWNSAMYDANDWAGRGPGQPFFMQVQLAGGKLRGDTDESARRLAERAARELGSATDPAKVTLPPYYPRDPVLLRDWAAYLDTVRFTDEHVSKVLRRLEQEGVLDQTLVIFMTDNGISHVRGKQFLYDEGTHMPFIVRGPGIPRGQVRTDLIEHIDMAAISLAAAGIPIPRAMQARDVFAKDYRPRDAIFAARDRCDETVERLRSVRTERFLYIRNFHPQRPHLQPNAYKDAKTILRTLRALHAAGSLDPLAEKLLFSPTRPPEELYEWKQDRYQIFNLADQPAYQKTLADLRAQLDRWRVETRDPGPESEARYDSDMAVYLDGRDVARNAVIRRNIELMKRWAREGR